MNAHSLMILDAHRLEQLPCPLGDTIEVFALLGRCRKARRVLKPVNTNASHKQLSKLTYPILWQRPKRAEHG